MHLLFRVVCRVADLKELIFTNIILSHVLTSLATEFSSQVLLNVTLNLLQYPRQSHKVKQMPEFLHVLGCFCGLFFVYLFGFFGLDELKPSPS